MFDKIPIESFNVNVKPHTRYYNHLDNVTPFVM